LAVAVKVGSVVEGTQIPRFWVWPIWLAGGAPCLAIFDGRRWPGGGLQRRERLREVSGNLLGPL
jgi:hypothetical protein